MAYLMQTNVSQSQLLSGIIGTVDVGSLVSQSIELAQDITRASSKLDEINKVLQSYFSQVNTDAISLASQDGSVTVKKGLNELHQSMQAIDILIRDATIQSAGGFKVSSTVLAQWSKFYSTFQHVDLLAKAIIDIPEAIAANKVVRYYNRTIQPNLPSEKDAFMLYRTKNWSKTDFVNRTKEIDGLTQKDAENILDIREWQTGKPSLRDAYYMMCKGLWSIPNFVSLAIKGYGYTAEDAQNLLIHYTYDFSPMEIMRINDLAPLDPLWIDKKLISIGLDKVDKEILKQAIAKRPIRDEITRIWGLLLDNYQWGLETPLDLATSLGKWNFSKAEIDLRLETAELMKLKLRVKLMRDAEVYLYRSGTNTESELLVALTNLGISKDIANAIVRYEAAKKGVEWEIPVD